MTSGSAPRRWSSATPTPESRPRPGSCGNGPPTEDPMKLRVFVPPEERPAAAARWSWILLDAGHGPLREGATPISEMPRASDAELVLPAARVLFARLRLPRVGGATLRELLPFAVEDRLLADPSHIHAVAG